MTFVSANLEKILKFADSEGWGKIVSAQTPMGGGGAKFECM